MADAEDELNAYEILEIETTATEADIKKAYRQKSLKVHPDRHPNNPQAAQKFHELNNAYELLLDPIRKTELDTKLKAQQARKIRFAAHDSKRKAMLDELEKSERDFKKSKLDERMAKDARLKEEERIKEEGKRLVKERQDAALAKERQQEREAKGKEKAADAPPAGPLDSTIRLKYTTTDHPTLTSPDAIAKLLQPYGEIDVSSIVLSIKPNKKNPSKPGKYATALVPFARVSDAFGAVMASGRDDKGLGGVDIAWAEGREPAIVAWLKEHGELRDYGKAKSPPRSSTPGQTRLPTPPSTSNPFSSFPDDISSDAAPTKPPPATTAPDLDFESLTFMRMRQAERARLEREILEAEAKES
ncbi:hypothetical protein FRB99_002558 [Tulasnella sp. 403]|nr:hypothetical protein FRB99_002558 [Tulasnella sp. 403]